MLMIYYNPPIFFEFDWIVFPSQYVAYAEGLIRAYNIHTYAVHYTLQRKMIFYIFIYYRYVFILIFFVFILCFLLS